MKTLEEQIKVMQAYADGKTIKMSLKYREASRTFNSFNCPPKITFDWSGYDYDIVEEPIVKYMVVVSQDGSSVCDYDRYEDAKSKLEDISYDRYKIIKLVQDMDFKGGEE